MKKPEPQQQNPKVVECADVDVSLEPHKLIVSVYSESELVIDVVVEAHNRSCRTMMRQCWDGQGWVAC